MRPLLPVLTLLLGAGPPDGPDVGPLTPAPAIIRDIFGRPLDRHGLILVDWEGQIANPAIRFDLVPPPDAAYPVRFVIRAKEPRLYFDLPSDCGPSGPRKEVLFQGPARHSMAVSIFPDRDGRDEDHTLDVEVTFADGKRRTLGLPLHVADQDRVRPPSFAIAVDFSQDRTGFFEDEARRRAVIRAAEDWAYFFDGEGLEPVPAGSEATLIWNPDGFKSTRRVRNEREYIGYLLYAYGIDGAEIRSGGEPSRTRRLPAPGWQVAGDPTLRAVTRPRSRATTAPGDGWWTWATPTGTATNLRDMPADLESIAHHEIGHALIFNPVNTSFGAAKLFGRLRDDRLARLPGLPTRRSTVPITCPVRSTRPACTVPSATSITGRRPTAAGRSPGRICSAQAVGYRLRETSAFAPVYPDDRGAPRRIDLGPLLGEARRHRRHPVLSLVEVTAGSLPDGLSLDPFTGELRGTPGAAGILRVHRARPRL